MSLLTERVWTPKTKENFEKWSPEANRIMIMIVLSWRYASIHLNPNPMASGIFSLIHIEKDIGIQSFIESCCILLTSGRITYRRFLVEIASTMAFDKHLLCDTIDRITDTRNNETPETQISDEFDLLSIASMSSLSVIKNETYQVAQFLIDRKNISTSAANLLLQEFDSH